MSCFLAQEGLRSLLDLLGQRNAPLGDVAAKFKSCFSEDAWPVVAATIQALQRDAEMLTATFTNASETLIAFFLLHLMFDTAKASTTAKVAFYELLGNIELLLRQDMRKAEQLKYRENSKQGATSRKTAKDATDQDAMRIRLVLKLFALTCLTKSCETSQSASQMLVLDADKANERLDALAQGPSSLKEQLADFAHLCETDYTQVSLGGPSSVAAVVGTGGVVEVKDEVPRAHAVITAQLARQPPAVPGPSQGELRVVLSPSLATVAAFDSRPHSAEWQSARKQLAAAAAGTLTTADAEKLLATLKTKSVAQSLGITPSVFVAVAAKNADVAAAIAASSAAPSELFKLLVSSDSKVAPPVMDDLVGRSAAVLQLQDLTRFVAYKKDHVATTEHAKSFVAALAKLLTSGNKELALSAAMKDTVAAMLKAHHGAAEVAAFIKDHLEKKD